jgi:hypothetical protein
MLTEKIIDLTTCWAKNQSNCANVISSIIVVDKEESTTTMINRTFAQFNIFLVQLCSSIYNLPLGVIVIGVSGC